MDSTVVGVAGSCVGLFAFVIRQLFARMTRLETRQDALEAQLQTERNERNRLQRTVERFVIWYQIVRDKLLLAKPDEIVPTVESLLHGPHEEC